MADCSKCVKLKRTIKQKTKILTHKTKQIYLYKELCSKIDFKKLRAKKFDKSIQCFLEQTVPSDHELLVNQVNENEKFVEELLTLRATVSELKRKLPEAELKFNHIDFVNKQICVYHKQNEITLDKFKRDLIIVASSLLKYDANNPKAKACIQYISDCGGHPLAKHLNRIILSEEEPGIKKNCDILLKHIIDSPAYSTSSSSSGIGSDISDIPSVNSESSEILCKGNSEHSLKQISSLSPTYSFHSAADSVIDSDEERNPDSKLNKSVDSQTDNFILENNKPTSIEDNTNFENNIIESLTSSPHNFNLNVTNENLSLTDFEFDGFLPVTSIDNLNCSIFNIFPDNTGSDSVLESIHENSSDGCTSQIKNCKIQESLVEENLIQDNNKDNELDITCKNSDSRCIPPRSEKLPNCSNSEESVSAMAQEPLISIVESNFVSKDSTCNNIPGKTLTEFMSIEVASDKNLEKHVTKVVHDTLDKECLIKDNIIELTKNLECNKTSENKLIPNSETNEVKDCIISDESSHDSDHIENNSEICGENTLVSKRNMFEPTITSPLLQTSTDPSSNEPDKCAHIDLFNSTLKEFPSAIGMKSSKPMSDIKGCKNVYNSETSSENNKYNNVSTDMNISCQAIPELISPIKSMRNFIEDSSDIELLEPDQNTEENDSVQNKVSDELPNNFRLSKSLNNSIIKEPVLQNLNAKFEPSKKAGPSEKLSLNMSSTDIFGVKKSDMFKKAGSSKYQSSLFVDCGESPQTTIRTTMTKGLYQHHDTHKIKSEVYSSFSPPVESSFNSCWYKDRPRCYDGQTTSYNYSHTEVCKTCNGHNENYGVNFVNYANCSMTESDNPYYYPHRGHDNKLFIPKQMFNSSQNCRNTSLVRCRPNIFNEDILWRTWQDKCDVPQDNFEKERKSPSVPVFPQLAPRVINIGAITKKLESVSLDSVTSGNEINLFSEAIREFSFGSLSSNIQQSSGCFPFAQPSPSSLFKISSNPFEEADKQLFTLPNKSTIRTENIMSISPPINTKSMLLKTTKEGLNVEDQQENLPNPFLISSKNKFPNTMKQISCNIKCNKERNLSRSNISPLNIYNSDVANQQPDSTSLCKKRKRSNNSLINDDTVHGNIIEPLINISMNSFEKRHCSLSPKKFESPIKNSCDGDRNLRNDFAENSRDIGESTENPLPLATKMQRTIIPPKAFSSKKSSLSPKDDESPRKNISGDVRNDLSNFIKDNGGSNEIPFSPKSKVHRTIIPHTNPSKNKENGEVSSLFEKNEFIEPNTLHKEIIEKGDNTTVLQKDEDNEEPYFSPAKNNRISHALDISEHRKQNEFVLQKATDTPVVTCNRISPKSIKCSSKILDNESSRKKRNLIVTQNSIVDNFDYNHSSNTEHNEIHHDKASVKSSSKNNSKETLRKISFSIPAKNKKSNRTINVMTNKMNIAKDINKKIYNISGNNIKSANHSSNSLETTDSKDGHSESPIPFPPIKKRISHFSNVSDDTQNDKLLIIKDTVSKSDDLGIDVSSLKKPTPRKKGNRKSKIEKIEDPNVTETKKVDVSTESAFKVPSNKPVKKNKKKDTSVQQNFEQEEEILRKIFEDMHCISPLSPLSEDDESFNDELIENIEWDEDKNTAASEHYQNTEKEVAMINNYSLTELNLELDVIESEAENDGPVHEKIDYSMVIKTNQTISPNTKNSISPNYNELRNSLDPIEEKSNHNANVELEAPLENMKVDNTCNKPILKLTAITEEKIVYQELQDVKQNNQEKEFNGKSTKDMNENSDLTLKLLSVTNENPCRSSAENSPLMIDELNKEHSCCEETKKIIGDNKSEILIDKGTVSPIKNDIAESVKLNCLNNKKTYSKKKQHERKSITAHDKLKLDLCNSQNEKLLDLPLNISKNKELICSLNEEVPVVLGTFIETGSHSEDNSGTFRSAIKQLKTNLIKGGKDSNVYSGTYRSIIDCENTKPNQEDSCSESNSNIVPEILSTIDCENTKLAESISNSEETSRRIRSKTEIEIVKPGHDISNPKVGPEILGSTIDFGSTKLAANDSNSEETSRRIRSTTEIVKPGHDISNPKVGPEILGSTIDFGNTKLAENDSNSEETSRRIRSKTEIEIVKPGHDIINPKVGPEILGSTIDFGNTKLAESGSNSEETSRRIRSKTEIEIVKPGHDISNPKVALEILGSTVDFGNTKLNQNDNSSQSNSKKDPKIKKSTIDGGSNKFVEEISNANNNSENEIVKSGQDLSEILPTKCENTELDQDHTNSKVDSEMKRSTIGSGNRKVEEDDSNSLEYSRTLRSTTDQDNSTVYSRTLRSTTGRKNRKLDQNCIKMETSQDNTKRHKIPQVAPNYRKSNYSSPFRAINLNQHTSQLNRNLPNVLLIPNNAIPHNPIGTICPSENNVNEKITTNSENEGKSTIKPVVAPVFHGFYTDIKEELSSTSEENSITCNDPSNECTTDNKKEQHTDINFNKRQLISEVQDYQFEAIVEPPMKKHKSSDLDETVDCKDDLFFSVLKHVIATSNFENDKPKCGNANKQNSEKARIKAEISKVIHSEDTFLVVNRVVESMKLNTKLEVTPKIFVMAICEILMEDKATVINEKPFMSKKIVSCTGFTMAYVGPHSNEFLLDVLRSIEEILGAYHVKTLSILMGVKLISYYTTLCRAYSLEQRLKLTLIDILYSRPSSHYGLFVKVLQIWPEILVQCKACTSRDCLLTQTIISIILTKEARFVKLHNDFMKTYSIITLRSILRMNYGYNCNRFTSNYIQLADKSIKRISEEGSRKALILLCHTLGLEWSKPIVDKKLFPLLLGWMEGKVPDYIAEDILTTTATIIRGMPVGKELHFIKKTMDLFEEILHKSPDDHFTEKVVEALSLLRRHNLRMVAIILMKFTPSSNKMTEKTIGYVKRILTAQKLHPWLKIYQASKNSF